jgi:AhpD family alkylhydroperoxidase
METIERARISFSEIPAGLYAAMQNTEKYIRECGLPHSLMELVKIRASQTNRCGFCLDMHHKDALKAGERFDRLYLLPAWEEAPCFSDEEKAALRLTDVLTTISTQHAHDIEAAYDHAAEFYTKEEIANLVLLICQINSWNRIAITFGTVPGSYQPK